MQIQELNALARVKRSHPRDTSPAQAAGTVIENCQCRHASAAGTNRANIVAFCKHEMVSNQSGVIRTMIHCPH